MYKSTAIACLAALAAAAPAPNAGVTAYNANFDDLGVSEAAITPIGPYDGLNYEGIDLVTLGAAGTIVAGVIPKSPPNAAAFGATTIATQGPPMIVTTGTTTRFFDFNSFYFGCVIGTLESAASAPVACTVTVTGYRFGVKLASQSFSFNPGPAAVTAPMTKANLGFAFNDVDKVTFSTSYAGSSATGATLLDNLSYITAST